MKTLLLLRHGKSSWETGSLPDHERPLSPRGVKAARRMGRFLARAGPRPDRVLCSTAVRAAETLRHAAGAGAWRAPVAMVPALYGASPADVLACLAGAGGDVDTLLAVGHEPACSETVAALAGGAGVRFPTAALACIGLDLTRWDAVGPGRGELLWLVTPRLLARLDG